MRKRFMVTVVYACVGGAVAVPVATPAIANDPCAGHDVVCGLNDQNPDECSVCLPSMGGGHDCWTDSIDTIKLSLPGCVQAGVDPMGSFADLPPAVRDKLPRRPRQPQFDISRPNTGVPTTREPQGGRPSTREPQIPGTASTAGRQ